MSDFFSLDHFHQSAPYHVYLGPLGPLQTSLYRSIAPPKAGPDDGANPQFEAVDYSDSLAPGETYRSIRSDWPCTIPHVIVIIDMPRAEEIIRTMQECFAEAQYKANSTMQAVPNDPTNPTNPTEADGWLTSHDQASSSQSQPIGMMNTSQAPQTSSSGHGDSLPNTSRNQQQTSNESFMPDTLGQGDIGLDQIFDPPHDQSRDRPDVDDITAVLSNAQDTEFALSQIDDAFLTAHLDPTLQDTHSSNIDGPPGESQTLEHDQHQHQQGGTKREGDHTGITTPLDPALALAPSVPDASASALASESVTSPPNLQLMTPLVEGTKIEMVPLPLVLIRQSDGVGFGVGRNVVAERVDSKAAGQDRPRWGESILTCGSTSARTDGLLGLRVVSD